MNKKRIFKLSLVFAFLLFANIFSVSNGKTSASSDNSIKLYNSNEDVVATYTKILPKGYIISEADGKNYVEFSTEDDGGYQLDKSKKYYYAGPRMMFEKISDNEYRHVLSNEIFAADEIDFSLEPSKNPKPVDRDLFASVIVDKTNKDYKTILEKKLPYKTYLYSKNEDKRCISVAFAIMMRYYNDHVSDKYVLKEHETEDGVKLINHLKENYFGTSTRLSTLEEQGNRYIKNRGIKNATLKYEYGLDSLRVFNKLKLYIDKKRPTIITTEKHKKYGDHGMVGTGYYITQNKDIKYHNAIVNDGWGHANIRINIKHVDSCFYIY